MPETPIEILERWEQHGGHWSATSINGSGATIELRTCLGEPVEDLRSSDSALLAYLAERSESDARPSG